MTDATDVVVVGAGPAGFMAASTLARYDVSVKLIDARPERIQTGHAGGELPVGMAISWLIK